MAAERNRDRQRRPVRGSRARPARGGRSASRTRQAVHVAEIADQAEASLLDLIDNLLNRGVVISGEVVLGVANVDLIYLRLMAVLCASDRLFPPERP